jgi:hypothetical protein
VYRARDAKLNRDVALKVLPTEFALDPDRVARFKREAQVLASLNHPNIAAIYGFEDSGHAHGLVLELVEGPTLADRIAQGAMPLDEALPIAKQMADALRAAHDQGVYSAKTSSDREPAVVKPSEHATDIGLGEIIAFEQERLASRAGERVGEHVAEIETGGVTALAEASVRASRFGHVFRINGDDHNVGFLDERIEFASTGLAFAGLDNEGSFEQVGS